MTARLRSAIAVRCGRVQLSDGLVTVVINRASLRSGWWGSGVMRRSRGPKTPGPARRISAAEHSVDALLSRVQRLLHGLATCLGFDELLPEDVLHLGLTVGHDRRQ